MSSIYSLTQLIVELFSILLVLQAPFSISLLCHKEERTVLLHLKSEFIYSNSTNVSSWIPNTDCCAWAGVRCHLSTGHVTEIFLNEQQLSGKLPDNLNASTLPRLSLLDLSSTNITGIIPAWLFQFPSLTSLDLGKNHFTGFHRLMTFPVVSPLKWFYASNNMLQGSIPKPILEIKSLHTLLLDQNNLTDKILFSQLYKLHSLTFLSLSFNNLSLVDDTNHNSTNTTAVTQILVPSSWPQFIFLGLSSCNLGEFPSFLKGQARLAALELANNNFHREVPDWMFDVARDTLVILILSNSKLTGGLNRLPWPSMSQIDLSSNMFVGPIPILPSKVILFTASNNKFNSVIPSWICDLAFIGVIDLSRNNITGNLPTCLVKVLGNGWLMYFDLKLNRLSGTISPLIFEQCQTLKILSLNTNQFEGQVPRSLAKCSQLQLLDLGNNQFNNTFPYWLGILPGLQVLILNSNNIYGSLPTVHNAASSFSKLQILDLSDNHLSGSLSCSFLLKMTSMIHVKEEYGSLTWPYIGTIVRDESILAMVKGTQRILQRISYNLVSVDVSNNQIQGQIPYCIGDLSSLNWLNLSHNDFSGHIPSSLGNPRLLESLDLSSNQLCGRIPDDLVELEFLEFFNVSNNNLTGPVPIANQFSSFQDKSYQGNQDLCGPFLTKKCEQSGNNGSTNSSSLMVENHDSPLYNWEFIVMGCGCGFVIGFVLGHFLFMKITPMWLLRITVWLENYLEKKKNSAKRRD